MKLQIREQDAELLVAICEALPTKSQTFKCLKTYEKSLEQTDTTWIDQGFFVVCMCLFVLALCLSVRWVVKNNT